VLFITVTLFILSFETAIFEVPIKAVTNISIISDIIRKKEKKDTTPIIIATIPLSIPSDTSAAHKDSIIKIFYSFSIPDRVTSYLADTSDVAINRFIQKLYDLKIGKKKKIRIAFFGDSMIEGDLISSTLRKLMQQKFGGYGVGFVPVTSIVANERITITHRFSDNWQDVNFKNHRFNTAPLYISGHTFFASGKSTVQVEDKTIEQDAPLNKYLLFGYANQTIDINSNGVIKKLQPTGHFNEVLLDNSNERKIKIEVSDDNLPLYGLSLESPEGIIVDNFSYRGSAGIEYGKMDTDFLASIAKTHSYDLIIMQYGVNLLEKPDDGNFDWYYKPMKIAVQRIQQSFKDADVLIMSTGDRAFHYPSGFQTATGLLALLNLQQRIAFETGSSFFNLYSSMGGENSMVKWVTDNPPLAYKDYTHPNSRGADVIGKSIYNALLYEYNKIVIKNH